MDALRFYFNPPAGRSSIPLNGYLITTINGKYFIFFIVGNINITPIGNLKRTVFFLCRHPVYSKQQEGYNQKYIRCNMFHK